jgi:hypothetical protein
MAARYVWILFTITTVGEECRDEILLDSKGTTQFDSCTFQQFLTVARSHGIV